MLSIVVLVAMLSHIHLTYIDELFRQVSAKICVDYF